MSRNPKGLGRRFAALRYCSRRTVDGRRARSRDPRVAPGPGRRCSRRIPRSSPGPTSRPSPPWPGPIGPPSPSSSIPNFPSAYAKALIEKRYDLVHRSRRRACIARRAERQRARRGVDRAISSTETSTMKTRAAVAFAPSSRSRSSRSTSTDRRRAKCWSRSWRPASATPTPTRLTGSTAKGMFPSILGHEGRGDRPRGRAGRHQRQAGRPRHPALHARMPPV